VVFVGLELSALDTPNLESPPTNSLPPLRWPLREGVTGAFSSSDVGVFGGVSCKPVVSPELKVKFGRVEVALLWAFTNPEDGGRLMCIDDGRLAESSSSRRARRPS
jgi:hypothetical protein